MLKCTQVTCRLTFFFKNQYGGIKFQPWKRFHKNASELIVLLKIKTIHMILKSRHVGTLI